MRYISTKASLKGNVVIELNTIVLGATVVDEQTLIGNNVILGYPTRAKVLSVLNGNLASSTLSSEFIKVLDNLSSGCRIGRHCIIRANTVIYEGTVIGDYVETGHFVLIRENTVIGDNTKVGSGTIIDGNVRIGNNVNIQSRVYIPPKTVIHDNVFLGPGVMITNDKYPVSKRLKGVIIEDGVVIGAHAVLVAGVRVGRNSVVAAGAVVTRDVPPEVVVAGVPARIISSREEYERKKRAYESEEEELAKGS